MHRFTSLVIVWASLLSAVVFAQPPAKKSKPAMKDFVGLNGHFAFKPDLYKPVCRLVRNYHNMPWDVKKPGDPIRVPKCVNKVNWETQVYGPWVKAGYEVDLCAQFSSFGEGNKEYMKLWKGQEKWIHNYGHDLAKFFGPSGSKKLVTSIEIGNEPGNDFDDTLYQRLFVNMARGIRTGDPKMKIVTATAHAHKSDKYSKSLQETFSKEPILSLYDVINVHVYPLLPKKKGRSPWDRSYPEDPQIDYLKIVDDTIAWRNKHAPGKEIWITEFGYDACTPEAMKKRTGWFKKLNWQGVTEKQQAQYLVRSLLCFAERDIDRAYIYFYNDKDGDSVHASSGLTRNFKPKPAFWAVAHFQKTLGDYRFSKSVLKKEGDLYVQEYVNTTDPRKLVWVAWSPTGSKRSKEQQLSGLPRRVTGVEQMPLKEGDAPKPKGQMEGSRGMRVSVGESPIYIFITK